VRNVGCRVGASAMATAVMTVLASQPLLAAVHSLTVEALGKMSIDELVDIQVTSVSRRPEPLNKAAASHERGYPPCRRDPACGRIAPRPQSDRRAERRPVVFHFGARI